MALQKIGLEAILKTAAFDKAVSKYIKDVGKLTKETQSASTNIGQRFLGLGASVTKFAAITGAAFLGVTAAAGGMALALTKDSIETAISIETAFAGVIKTTDGLTSEIGVLNEAGKELKEGFKDLSKEIPLRVEDLMRIGELGGQLGIQKDNLLEFTRVIADIGVSTDLSTEEASMGFARFMNIMSTAQEDVDRLGSSIVDLGNNFATTEPEILSFALRIAGAGQIAGLTEADVLGIGAAMSSIGVQAEAGGTAVQKVLLSMMLSSNGVTTSVVDNSAAIAKSERNLAELSEKLGIARQRLAETTDKTSESTRMTREKAVRDLEAKVAQEEAALAGLAAAHGRTRQSIDDDLKIFAQTAGVSVSEWRRLWEEDAGKAFEMFVAGLGEQGDGAVTTLNKLGLADQRLVRSFLSLSGAGDLLSRSMEMSSDAWEENTALATEAAQRYATTESQMQMLQNRWRDVKDDIGTALLPAMRDLGGMFATLVEKHGPKLVALFEKHVAPALEEVTEALGSLMEGDIAGFVGNLREAFTDLVGEDVAERVFKVTDAIAEFMRQAVAFVTEHSEEFKAAIIAIGAVLASAAIASIITGIVTAIGVFVTGGIGPLILAIGVLAAAWVGDWGGIRTTLTKFWYETLVPFVQAVGVWFTVTLPAAIAALGEWFSATWASIVAAVNSAWVFLVGIWNGIVAFFTVTIPNALLAVGEWFRSVWESIRAAIQTVWDGLVEIWNGIVNIFTVVIPTAAQALLQSIIDAMVAIGDKIIEVWQGIFAFLQNVWDLIRIAVVTALILLLDSIGIRLEDLIAFWQASWELIKETAREVWQLLLLTITTIFNTILSTIQSILARVHAIWDYWWNRISAVANVVWYAIKAIVTALLEEISTFIANTIQGIKARWELIWFAISTIASDVWAEISTAIQTAFEKVRDFITKVLEGIKAFWDEYWNTIQDIALEVWNHMTATIEGILDTLVTVITEMAERIKRAFIDPIVAAKDLIVGMVSDFVQLGRDLIGGLVSGVADKAGSLIDSVTGTINDAIGRAKALLGISSPSKVAARELGSPLGEGISMGLADALKQLSTVKLPRMMAELTASSGLNGYGSRVYAPAAISPSMTRIGGNTQINQQFDLTAQYRYENESSLMDEVRLLRMIAGAR